MVTTMDEAVLSYTTLTDLAKTLAVTDQGVWRGLIGVGSCAGRPHKSLKNPYPRTPAMPAGVADHVLSLREIAGLLD